jgi:hypothetical protein
MFNCPFCEKLDEFFDGEEITEYYCKCHFLTIFKNPDKDPMSISLHAYGPIGQDGKPDLYTLHITHTIRYFAYLLNDENIGGFNYAIEAYEDILKMKTLEVLNK